MSDRYKSIGIYREEQLYHELGFRFIQNKNDKIINNKNIGLFYIIALTLMIHIFVTYQIFTIILIMFYFLLRNYPLSKAVSILVLIGHSLDYLMNGYIIPIDRLIDDKITILFWILEIFWIIAYGYYLLSIMIPTNSIDPKITVKPVRDDSIKLYESMKKRLVGTKYEINNWGTRIELKELQYVINNLIYIIIIIFLSVLIIDYIIWIVLPTISTGNNVKEIYFTSVLSLLLYLLLIVNYYTFVKNTKN